ncbi:hypothetical protein G6F56_000439 [Rhizopus delemar]|uniref:Zn(2)-C6 fungal-type domain-containing protein n=1 Tax=Rhizopus stolonifer TaxID=4846 RepID=A0A367KY90_RHIST|nr:hypothetical protein G6F56_000439 [Rhizopus delemar]RCI07144.1 hypothetical protein CU098_013929 [Rhizopus stolonifer]
MVRKIPCQYCKIRRRKCERNNESEPCLRCIKNKRKCVPQGHILISHSSSDEEEEIDEKQYMELCQQVDKLQLGIKELEINLNKQKAANAAVKQEPTWDLHFKNGQLMLGTKINDFQELALYRRSFLRYLSPFGHTFQTSALIFEPASPGLLKRIICVMGKLNGLKNGRKKSIYENSLVTKCLRPDIYLDRLINIYFHCFNNVVPLVHEVTFRRRYESLKNKLDDPVTLAICATACVFICPHSDFDSHEKRFFGEYFYNRCMDKLINMFDEPEYYLESLIVANILQCFIFVTLRLSESKKWATIAVVLASNLKQIYPDYREGNKQQNYATRVLYSTLHRNCIFAHIVLCLIELCVDHRIDNFETFVELLDILPDEPPFTQGMVELANYIQKLESHPVMKSIFKKSRYAFFGETTEWTIEDVISFESVVIDWWKKLPEYFKLAPSRVLVRSIDALVSVMSLKESTVTLKTKIKIKEYMDEFSNSISPEHHISSKTSPLSSVSWANPEFTLPSQDLYELYPLPAEALIFDVVQTSVTDITNV